jgi:hypothetical protein
VKVTELRDLERRTFRAATDDGLLDIMMAAIVSMFAVAPLLSDPLGDFWSSAVFGPFWFAMYLAIRVVHKHVVAPRIGTVEPGTDRRRRLRRVTIVLFVVNAFALVIGVAAAFGLWAGWLDLTELVYPIALGVAALIVFSMTAYALSVGRYAIYGLLVAAAPLGGEWLWRNDLAAHHGYPAGFGAVALIMVVTGIVRLTTLLRNHPLPRDTATV